MENTKKLVPVDRLRHWAKEHGGAWKKMPRKKATPSYHDKSEGVRLLAESLLDCLDPDGCGCLVKP